MEWNRLHSHNNVCNVSNSFRYEFYRLPRSVTISLFSFCLALLLWISTIMAPVYVINVRTHKIQKQNVPAAIYNAKGTLHTFTQSRSKLICKNIEGHTIELNTFEYERVNGLCKPCWALSIEHTHAFLRSHHHWNVFVCKWVIKRMKENSQFPFALWICIEMTTIRVNQV